MLTDAVEVANKVLRSLPGIVSFATDKEVKQTTLTTTTAPKTVWMNYFDIDPTIFSQLTTIVEEADDGTKVIYCHRKSDKVVCWHILSRSCYDWIFVDIEESESRSRTGKEENSDKVYAVIYGVIAAMFPESFKYTHCGNYTELLKSVADVTIPQAVAHWKANGGEGKKYYSDIEGRSLNIDEHGQWYTCSALKVRDSLTGDWYAEKEECVEGGKIITRDNGRAHRLKNKEY
jgi:hypothetical protein